MKKLMALALTLMMTLSLVACGGDKKDDAKDETKPANSGAPAESKPVESLVPPLPIRSMRSGSGPLGALSSTPPTPTTVPALSPSSSPL